MKSQTFVAAAVMVLCALIVAPALPLRADGSLVPTDRNVPPLRLKLHDVTVNIDNQLATTKVTQIFVSDANQPIEAIYTFPVPAGASISDFSMWMDGKEVKGAIMEKKEAAAIYESIVRQSKDPGLLEHVAQNTFRVRVFPIPAKGEQKISIAYSERIPYRAGTCVYRYPLMIKNIDSANVSEFSLRAWIASAIPIQSFESATHKMNVIKKDDRNVVVTLNNASGPLNADFEIRYVLQKEKTGFDLACTRVQGDDGTFMMIVTPKMKITDADIIPKDMTFVFDTSGSMAGEKIAQAAEALAFCIKELRKGDRFNIVTFSTDVIAFSKEHLPATEENKKRAVKFIGEIAAFGGTNIHDALLKALEYRGSPSRTHIILFLTDGIPTQGETNPKTIVDDMMKTNTAGTRIFTFGVGNDLNRSLLDQIVNKTRAVAEYIGAGENIADKVTSLNGKLSMPVLTQISVDWGEADVHSIYPKEIPDLYAHTQLTIVGRYKHHGKSKIRMTGRFRDKEAVIEEVVEFPEAREGSEEVARLWAMRKIGYLQEQIELIGSNRELVDEIVSLSKKHRVATPYTSFLALEPEMARRLDSAPRSAGQDPVEYEAQEFNHNESADNEFKSRKGESMDMPSDKPFQGSGTYDLIGGGGAGGAFGGRKGGAVARDPDSPVLRGLKWLAKNQHADGSWGEQGCEMETTGYALLAFLGAGYYHGSKDVYDGICFGDVMKNALKYLLNAQDAEGCLAPRRGEYLNDHLLCALALCEAYGLIGSDLLKAPAQKAVDFTMAAQNDGGGWGYLPKDGRSNSLTTGLAVMVMKGAELSGLNLPANCYTKTRNWFDTVTNEHDRLVGFASKSDQGKITGADAKFADHPTATAMALSSRILGDKNRNGAPTEWADILSADLPRWEESSADAEYWYFATLAISHYDPLGPVQSKWNTALKEIIVRNQSGGNEGSWKAIGRLAGKGAAHTTALNTLTLTIIGR